MANTSLLRAALRLNAVFSISTGVAAAVFAEHLATLLNLPAPALSALGMLLAVYSAALGALSLTDRVASLWTVCATALDIAWVIGSIAFVVLREVPASWLVLVTAAGVLACACLQLAGLRRATVVTREAEVVLR